MVKTARHIGYDYLRALATIAVVVIHTVFSAKILFLPETEIQNHITLDIVSDFCWFAVPVFLMLTGAFLLNPDKEITYKSLFTKYIWRITKTLTVFGYGFALMELFFSTRTISVGMFWNAFVYLIGGKTWEHMWYLYMLIGIYFMLPLYRKVIEASNSKDIKYIILIMFVFLSVFPIFEQCGIAFGFYLPTSLIYPLYLFMGFAIHNGIVKANEKVAIMALCINSVLIAFTTIVDSETDIAAVTYLNSSYQAPLIVIESALMFMVFSNIKQCKFEFIHRILVELADKSFGIYLLHMFWVNLFYKVMRINPFSLPGYTGFVLLTVLNLACSYVVIGIMKRIPYIRTLVN